MKDKYSELSLVREYEPRKISELLGNSEAKKEIIDALGFTIKPKSWILHGQSGCGKTLVSNLIASELNYSDVVSIDIVSVNDSDFRETVENSILRGDLKVFVIENADSISTQDEAWVKHILGMLKGRAIVILCALQLSEINSDLVSMCDKCIELSEPEVDELCEFLEDVCISLGAVYDHEGVYLLASSAIYSVSHALRKLEEVLKLRGYVDFASVDEVLTSIDLFGFSSDLEEEEF